MKAVLEVGTFSSRCRECGLGADPYEATHETVLSYSPGESVGCGVRWTHVEPTYFGMNKLVADMRPDLTLIPLTNPAVEARE